MSLNTYNVLNSIAATAADFSLSAQNFSITGAPVIRYGDITSAGNGFLYSLAATRARKSMAFTAANNTTYSFRVKQTVSGVDKNSLITYTSDSSGTAAEIIAAFSAQLTALGFDITVTGSSSPIILTGSSTNPLFTITDVANTATTAVMDKCFGTGGAASVTSDYLINTFAIAGTTTVTITSTNHGLSTGMTVVWTQGNGTGTINSATSGTFRVTVTGANTFTLDLATGASLVIGTTDSLLLVAQEPRGTYSQLYAQGISGVTSGNTYTQLVIQWDNKVADGYGVDSQRTSRLHTIYFNDTDTDFVALAADIVLKLKGYTTGTTPNVAAFNQLPL